MSHNFKPGDLIRDTRTREYGLVVRINPSELIVAWQDCDCLWDTDPEVAQYVCHIPGAKDLSLTQDQIAERFETLTRERYDTIIELLKAD